MSDNPAIKSLQEWLSPTIPFGLMFGKRHAALELLSQINEQLESITMLQEQLNQAEQEVPELKNQLNQAQQQLSQLQKTLAETNLRQTLVARLLSANNQNQGVKEYFQLLNHDFLEFANKEDALQDEAAAFLELQEIGDELKVVGSYPEFYKKRSIAIAGGFSAGKSEFISSLFQDNTVRLPIGIEPTTAIPTYALNGTKNGVIGCSQNGGVIDLLEIDPDFQHKLSHNFIRGFGFNLKAIMPFVFLTTPMDFKHLCFIDTPGYNPSDVADGHTSEDIKTAEEFVHNAEALLWLIGLDSNGTISKSDLDFLDHVSQNTQKPLYIVLNKADLRPYDQLEDIMDEIVDTLDDYDIQIEGMSAYSSISKEEFTFHKKSLADFLKELDTPSDKHNLILERLYAVDEKYQRAILRVIKENKQINTTLSGLKLDLLQNGFDDLGSDLYEKISKMNALFAVVQKEEHLKQLEQVTQKMVTAIDQVFGQAGSLQRKKWTIEEIELDEKFARLTKKDEIPDELDDKQSKSSQKDTQEQPEPVLGLRELFWNHHQKSSLRIGVVNGLDALLSQQKETFTLEEFAKSANVNVRIAKQDLDELEELDMVRCLDSQSKAKQGARGIFGALGIDDEDEDFKPLLSWLGGVDENTQYEFVLPECRKEPKHGKESNSESLKLSFHRYKNLF